MLLVLRLKLKTSLLLDQAARCMLSDVQQYWQMKTGLVWLHDYGAIRLLLHRSRRRHTDQSPERVLLNQEQENCTVGLYSCSSCSWVYDRHNTHATGQQDHWYRPPRATNVTPEHTQLHTDLLQCHEHVSQYLPPLPHAITYLTPHLIFCSWDSHYTSIWPSYILFFPSAAYPSAAFMRIKDQYISSVVIGYTGFTTMYISTRYTQAL